MGLRVRIGDPAIHPVVHGGLGHKAEGLQLCIRVSGLTLQLVKVDAAAVDPGGGAGLEPAQRQPRRPQTFGKGTGGMLTVRAGGIAGIAHKDPAPQVGAGGQHNALGPILSVQLGAHALYPALADHQLHHFGLMDGKAGGQLQRLLHIGMVAAAVGLHPQSVHSRAFALVQHPALQVGGVGGQAHQPAQSVHLPHQGALCRPADAGVAGHIADAVQAHSKNSGACPQPGRRMGGLDAGMTRAD